MKNKTKGLLIGFAAAAAALMVFSFVSTKNLNFIEEIKNGSDDTEYFNPENVTYDFVQQSWTENEILQMTGEETMREEFTELYPTIHLMENSDNEIPEDMYFYLEDYEFNDTSSNEYSFDLYECKLDYEIVDQDETCLEPYDECCITLRHDSYGATRLAAIDSNLGYSSYFVDSESLVINGLIKHSVEVPDDIVSHYKNIPSSKQRYVKKTTTYTNYDALCGEWLELNCDMEWDFENEPNLDYAFAGNFSFLAINPTTHEYEIFNASNHDVVRFTYSIRFDGSTTWSVRYYTYVAYDSEGAVDQYGVEGIEFSKADGPMNDSGLFKFREDFTYSADWKYFFNFSSAHTLDEDTWNHWSSYHMSDDFYVRHEDLSGLYQCFHRYVSA